jgi:hypothetical protein
MSHPMRVGAAGAGLTGRKHVELIEASSDGVVAGERRPLRQGQGVAQLPLNELYPWSSQ